MGAEKACNGDHGEYGYLTIKLAIFQPMKNTARRHLILGILVCLLALLAIAGLRPGSSVNWKRQQWIVAANFHTTVAAFRYLVEPNPPAATSPAGEWERASTNLPQPLLSASQIHAPDTNAALNLSSNGVAAAPATGTAAS